MYKWLLVAQIYLHRLLINMMLSSVYRAGLLFSAGASFTLLHRLLFLQRQTKLGLNDLRIEHLLDTEVWQWVTPVIMCCMVGAVAGCVWFIQRKRIYIAIVLIILFCNISSCTRFHLAIARRSYREVEKWIAKSGMDWGMYYCPFSSRINNIIKYNT